MAENDSHTKLLLHCNGIDESTTFTDESVGGDRGNASIGGDAQVDTALKQFGTGSLLLNGSADFIYYPNHADWDFADGDFTIDFWFRFASTPPSGTQYLISQYDSGVERPIAIIYNNTQWEISSYDDGYVWNLVYEDVPDTNFHHLAVVRDNTGTDHVTLYIDGVEKVTTTTINGSPPTPNVSLCIGSHSDGTSSFDGRLDEIRIAKGVATWKYADGNFTPPDEEYESSSSSSSNSLSSSSLSSSSLSSSSSSLSSSSSSRSSSSISSSSSSSSSSYAATLVFFQEDNCQFYSRMFQGAGKRAIDESDNGYNLTPFSDSRGPDQMGHYTKLNKVYHEYYSSVFLYDPNLITLWRFEKNAITIDYIGTNTLFRYPNAPAEDIINYKEGACSVVFDRSEEQRFRVLSLSDNFPFKAGATNRNMTVCFYYKPETSLEKHVIISKYASDLNASFVIQKNFDSKLSATFYDTSDNAMTITFNTEFNTDSTHWYHCTVSINGTTGAYRLSIYDYTEKEQLGADQAGTLPGFSAPIKCSNSNLVIGGQNMAEYSDDGILEGNLDEMRIYNDIITTDEIANIVQSTPVELVNLKISGTYANLSIVGKLRLRTNVTTTSQGVVSKHNITDYQGQYAIRINTDNKIEFVLSPDGSSETTVVQTTALTLDTWYSFAGVYDSVDMRLYIDGELDNTQAYTEGIYGGTAPFEIGRINEDTASCANIDIQAISVFDRALSGA